MKDAAHKRFLESKRIRHFVFSQKFDKAMQLANEKERRTLKELVQIGTAKEIRTYVERLLLPDLENANITQLRHMAKQFGIRFYYYMTRTQLEESIKDAKERYSKSLEECDCKPEERSDCEVCCRSEQSTVHDDKSK